MRLNPLIPVVALLIAASFTLLSGEGTPEPSSTSLERQDAEGGGVNSALDVDAVESRRSMAPSAGASSELGGQDNVKVECVAEGTGDRLAARIDCKTCGERVVSSTFRPIAIRHLTESGDEHEIVVSCPGYDRCEDVHQVGPLVPPGSPKRYTLRPNDTRALSLRLDRPSDLPSVQLRRVEAPRAYNSMVTAPVLSSSPLHVDWLNSARELSGGVEYRTTIGEHWASLLMLASNASTVDLAACRGEAVIDLRGNGKKVRLLLDGVPSKGVDVLFEGGREDVTYCLRTSDLNGEVILPKGFECRRVTLPRASSLVFDTKMAVGGAKLESGRVLDLEGVAQPEVIHLAASGWRFRLSDASNRILPLSAFQVVVDLAIGDGRTLRVRTYEGRTNANGIGRISLTLAEDGIENYSCEFRVAGIGAASLTMNSDMLSRFQEAAEPPAEIQLRSVECHYVVQINGAGDLLDGCGIEALDRQGTRRFLGVIEGSACAVATALAPGSYRLIVTSSLEWGLGPVNFRESSAGGEIVTVNVSLNDSLLKVISTDVPGESVGVDLFVLSEYGILSPFQGAVLDPSHLTVTVPPGRYAIGPYEWLRAEEHRMRDKSFGTYLKESDPRDLAVAWNPRWSATNRTVTTIKATGVGVKGLRVCPLFDASEVPFYGGQSPLLYEGDSHRVAVEVGDPEPIGYALLMDVAGLDRRRMAPVAYVPVGTSYEATFALADLVVDSTLDTSGYAAFFLGVETGGIPECLKRDFGRNRLSGGVQSLRRVGPLNLRSSVITLGQDSHARAVYPSPGSVSGVTVTVD